MSEKDSNESYINIITSLAVEITFTLLPFVVSITVFAYQGTLTNIFKASEWSIAASVLIGQTLIKMLYGGLSNRRNHTERIILFAALLVVFGLVPSLIVVVLVLISNPISNMLITIQILLFIISIFLFIVFGTIGEVLRTRGSLQ